MKFAGPRPAARALDGLMDEIGNPAVDLIKSLKLSPEVETDTIVKLNAIITTPFMPGDSTGAMLRDYIYDLNREITK